MNNIMTKLKTCLKISLNPMYLNDYINELFIKYPWSCYALKGEYYLNIIIIYRYNPPFNCYPKTIYMPFIYKGVPIVYNENSYLKNNGKDN